jgi:hypothetical protein
MQYGLKHPDQPLAAQPVAVRLPADVDRLWRQATSSDPSFFFRWAVTACLLKEGWATPENLTLLPLKSADGNHYELFSREEFAGRTDLIQAW